jgi:hypothetical protein
MGSGIAWGDFNNDGWQDVFLVNFSGSIDLTQEEISNSKAYSRLYVNNQDGTFTDVSEKSGLDLRTWANAAAWGDYDNDGWLDLAVSCYGKNLLFRNQGDWTFIESGFKSGISDFEGYWTGLAWGDYDRDGNIDLYICGYVDYQPLADKQISLQYNAEVPASINPSSFPPVRNLFFRNLGNGKFEEIAQEAGVHNDQGRSLSAAWCDFDHDGWPDLYVANDVSDNALFKNNGDGTFEDISYNSFVADYRGAMGIGVSDWDNDGDQDMFITHWIAQENALYTNLVSQLKNKELSPTNRIKFMDEADRWGLGQIALDFIGFGTFFFDYDNDGRQDIFVANGSTFQKRDDPKALIPMKDLLFWHGGNENGYFNVSPVSGSYFAEAHVGRGAAFADYDNDGDLDIMVTNNLGKAVLLRNDGGNNNNWIGIRLQQKFKNRFALGSTIRLVASGIEQVRQTGTQGTYFSQNTLTEHFGLQSIEMVDSVEISWPTGKSKLLVNVPVNQILEINED